MITAVAPVGGLRVTGIVKRSRGKVRDLFKLTRSCGQYIILMGSGWWMDAGDGKLVIKLKGLPWKADEDDVKNFLSGVDLVMDDGIVIVENGS